MAIDAHKVLDERFEAYQEKMSKKETREENYY